MKKETGFTLIETMVAVSIISMAILAPVTLAIKSMSVSGVSSNQVTASYLAQEGVEYIRYVRDTAALSDNPPATWYEGLDILCSEVFAPKGCQIDIVSLTNPISVCPSSGCPPLKYLKNNDDEGFFGYSDTGETTPFTRTVKFELSGDGSRALITSSVTWKERFVGQKTVEVKEYIFDIR